ncbi:hypothetical protein [Nocardia sp. NBC_01327]|nr:hypothetical protein OG326_15590 [Nocardia sp. NBC_01327]
MLVLGEGDHIIARGNQQTNRMVNDVLRVDVSPGYALLPPA